jgi:5-methylcytosine-specific restriction endonuclease McrA
MNRPCLDCSKPIPSGSRCDECRPPDHRPTAAQRGYDQKWRKLSEKARKAQPWCLRCGRKDRLQADHIVPFSEAPELRLCAENIRVLCQPCHLDRDPTTDVERSAVYAAINARDQRRTRFYLTELNPEQRSN